MGEASRHTPPAFQAADEALLRGAQAGALRFGLLSEVQRLGRLRPSAVVKRPSCSRRACASGAEPRCSGQPLALGDCMAAPGLCSRFRCADRIHKGTVLQATQMHPLLAAVLIPLQFVF